MRRLARIAAACACLCAPTSATRAADDGWIDRHVGELVTLYTHLHTHPELSLKEFETAKTIAAEFRKAGAEVTTGVGKLGVVGVLKNGSGPVVLVRTDLDALPVVEATGLPYASRVTTVDDAGKTVGVMHACGHDVHMTSLVGTARWLNDHRLAWKGTVLLIGQPAEEKVDGAEAMLKDGLYTRFPRPNYALALHVSHEQEAGKIGYHSGPAMASSTSVDVVVRGRGGHGAMPHNTVDPIVLAAEYVVDLQTIVSREVKPIDPAVITVGSFIGGSKHNIIPNDAHLQLTLRAFRPEVRDQLIAGLERRAKGLAAAHGAPPMTITVGEGTPPTVNTPALVAKVVPFLESAVGAANVEEVEATMGAEDFGLFGEGGVPTFMFRLGTIAPARLAEARSKGEPMPSLHSALYFPEPSRSVATGVRAMSAAVVGLLPPG